MVFRFLGRLGGSRWRRWTHDDDCDTLLRGADIINYRHVFLACVLIKTHSSNKNVGGCFFTYWGWRTRHLALQEVSQAY